MSRYFIAVHDFMIKDLKLKGFNLLLYALIYGYWSNYGKIGLYIDVCISQLNISRRQFYDCAQKLEALGLASVNGGYLDLRVGSAEIAQGSAEIAHLNELPKDISSTSNLKNNKKINEMNKYLNDPVWQKDLEETMRIAKTPWIKK